MTVKYKIIAAALDEAAEQAKTNADAGVELVIAMLNKANAAGDSAEVQYIMDAATARGLQCQFWPAGNGRITIKVQWAGVPA